MKKRRNPLKKIKNLKKIILDFSSRKLTNVPNDAKAKQIYELNLNYNKISSIENIAKFTNIRILHLSCNQLKVLSGIEALQKLEELNCQNNFLVKLPKLWKLSRIKVLNLQNNEIESLKYFSKIQTLESLNVSGNFIVDLSPIRELTKIKELFVSRNKLRSIGIFRKMKCKYLRELDLSLHKFEKFRFYSIWRYVRILNLENCRISSTENFVKLTRLRELNLVMNKLRDINNFGKLFPRLETLDVSNNEIGEIGNVLSNLRGLKDLCVLRLAGNPLCHDVDYRTAIFNNLVEVIICDGVENEKRKKEEENLDLHSFNEMGIDLSLPIEDLERQFFEKLKKGKEGKEGKKDEKMGKLDFGGDSGNLFSKGFKRKDKNKSETDDLLKSIELMNKEEEDDDMKEVTRLYEECRKASETVEKQIIDISSDFGGTYEEFHKKMREYGGVSKKEVVTANKENRIRTLVSTDRPQSSNPSMSQIVELRKSQIQKDNELDEINFETKAQRPKSSKLSVKPRKNILSSGYGGKKILKSIDPMKRRKKRLKLKKVEDPIMQRVDNQYNRLVKEKGDAVRRYNSTDKLFEELKIPNFKKRRRRKKRKKREILRPQRVKIIED